MSQFKTTHIIHHNARRIAVRMLDGACYTKNEWDTSSTADWEYDPQNGLLFQGNPPAGTWRIEAFRKAGAK